MGPVKGSSLTQISTYSKNLNSKFLLKSVDLNTKLGKIFLFKKKNSVAIVYKQTVPSERPPLVGEVSANFYCIEGVTRSGQWIPKAVF
jgi:hypothetical protein